MTVKDTYQTAGMRTTCGLPAWDHVPDHDAEAVRRLRDAGAVIFGKTNTPTLAGDWQTYNAIFGTTNNPWDTTRTTGGSSGGAAAAVATGMTALELGSDIGGSIRFPSNWCGVCGHKPTWGVVPQAGHLPPAPGTLSAHRSVGRRPAGARRRRSRTRARRARGCGGPCGRRVAAGASRHREADAGRSAARALARRSGVSGRAPRSATCLVSAARALRAAGAQRGRCPTRRRAAGRGPRCISSSSIRSCCPPSASGRFDKLVTLAESLPDDDDRPLARTARFATQRYRDWVFANEKREQLRALMAEFFCDVDALLMPVAMVPAIPHDHSEPFPDRVIRWTAAAGRTPT